MSYRYVPTQDQGPVLRVPMTVESLRYMYKVLEKGLGRRRLAGRVTDTKEKGG